MVYTTITGTTRDYVYGQAHYLEPLGYRPVKLTRNNGFYILRMGK